VCDFCYYCRPSCGRRNWVACAYRLVHIYVVAETYKQLWRSSWSQCFVLRWRRSSVVNMLYLINVVALRRARLVPGWHIYCLLAGI